MKELPQQHVNVGIAEQNMLGIAAGLAKGYDLESSIGRAKNYISGALAAMLDLGEGSGPMNHAFGLNSQFAK